MASPPCCPPGSHGPASDDTTHIPAGAWDNLADLDTYIVGEREQVKSVIIALSDVFGPRSGRHARVCDEIAEAVPGSMVCMPDLFRGKPILHAWPGMVTMHLCGMVSMLHRIRYRCGWCKVWPDINKILDALQSRIGSSVPVACFGFCWGAWCTFKCCSSNRFVAGVGFHPSLKPNMLQQSPDRDSDESMAQKIQCPLLLLPAGNDGDALKPGGTFFEIVREKHPTSQSVEYASMKHGWMSRGVESDAVLPQDATPGAVAEAQVSAIQEAANFFNQVLPK